MNKLCNLYNFFNRTHLVTKIKPIKYINSIVFNIFLGDWGLGIGDWAPIPQSPIPNPQSPIPNPQSDSDFY